ncbi:predicted protein [Nematostella vectensis]|uniref:Sulfatase N-terminal domain-containing protein n=1 Tax=Nematostella vectensis TaxID=45351 RepID=A7SUA5_NEMVE|nr:arylsulfatase B [Nematostella vectensis]EDO32709.1 predicted protein [Nematostella vectensis]|eukprot:XP_001624809.1 predicted protein [Nematostella vectensis]
MWHINALSLVLLSAQILSEANAIPPHIVFILVDDLGWFDLGYHGSVIRTPNINQLAGDGIILDNYYVQPLCTPTRSALMTGKYPIHLGTQHGVILPGQPMGLPLDSSTLPEQLKQQGYATHIVGKWHLGFYKEDFVPTKRGFDSFYGYYCGAEDHFTHNVLGFLDFRDNDLIVKDQKGTYGTRAFTKRAVDTIHRHNSSSPLFLYLPFQNVHGPVQAPPEYIDKYSFIKDKTRRTHAAMVDIMDEAIGNVTSALKSAGLWENTLLVFSTDNGGIHTAGGYNYPLRGEKNTLWEGGVRGAGFVSGPMAPRHGMIYNGLMHVTDWYPTLVHLAGGSMQDSLDGVDLWDALKQDTASPRKEILHNIDLKIDVPTAFVFEGVALRSRDMKLLLKVPNATWLVPPELREPGITANEGLGSAKMQEVIEVALYNITADPTERHDLSGKFPDIVNEMKKRVDFYRGGLVPPIIKKNDPKAVLTAIKNGAWSPWET